MDQEIANVFELMDGVIEDTTVPRNIRAAVQNAKEKIEKETGDVGLTNAIYILDDISNDINMPAHARTEIWTLISELEAIREKIKK